MQQVKSVRTILVRAIECGAWAKSARKKRAGGENQMRERSGGGCCCAGKGFNSNVGQALSCV